MSQQPARRLPPDEEAERQAFHRAVPIWARAKELGIRFSDVQGGLLPAPSIEAESAGAERSVADIDALLAKVHQRLGIDAPTAVQYIPEEPEQDAARQSKVREWYRRVLALAAALTIGFSLEPAWSGFQQHEHAKTARNEELLLGTAHHEVFPFLGPDTFDVDGHSVRGSIHRGAIRMENVGSAGDSAVSAKLLESSDVTIELEPNAHGLVLQTPTAEVQLLLPGRYEINSLANGVGQVKVDSGVAVVKAKNGTEHDWTIVRAGQVVRTRVGKLPEHL